MVRRPDWTLVETASNARPATLSGRWKNLPAQHRRRIVLGSLVAVSLAARDLMLFMVASGMFALSELGAAPTRRPAAA